MSVSSPEISLSSSSSSASKDDGEYWEINPAPVSSRLSSMDCWDYTIELECLKGPEGYLFYYLFILLFSRQIWFDHSEPSISSIIMIYIISAFEPSIYVIFGSVCKRSLNHWMIWMYDNLFFFHMKLREKEQEIIKNCNKTNK